MPLLAGLIRLISSLKDNPFEGSQGSETFVAPASRISVLILLPFEGSQNNAPKVAGSVMPWALAMFCIKEKPWAGSQGA